MDTDLLCVILRPRCRALWVLVPWSRASFKIILGCVSACVRVCVFTDTVATRSEEGNRGSSRCPAALLSGQSLV